MSAEGVSPSTPTSWQDSAVSGEISSDSEHQATLTKLKTPAYRPKEFSHVPDHHQPDESILATKILHKGQDGKPTVTLTDHESELCHLKGQLEGHFQGLRVVFEARTGREWQPLKAWPAEEWEWTWDTEEA